MSRNNNAQISYCTFSPPVPTIKYYTCYKKEICCQQGCCINGPYQIYQVWYYWLIFLVIFGVISGGNWLCKKPRPMLCTISRNPSHSSRGSCCSHSGCNRRRCVGYLNNNSENRDCNFCENGTGTNNSTDFEDNIILDRLFVSFRNRNTLGDPPSYSSILSSDYNNKPETKFSPLYSYYGPPPTYSSMYNSSSSQAVITNNENIPTHSSAAGVIQIQIHAEEQANKPITDGNKETGTMVPNENVQIRCENTSPGSININNERHREVPENLERNTAPESL